MNEREIFVAAFQQPGPAERRRYVEQACGSDPDLRRRVESLLRLADEAGSFLEHPVAGQVETVTHLPTDAEPTTGPPDPGERPGEAIGPYKLVEVIGEGGMGTVWLAQQTEPVRRLVALKVVKAGMDTRQVLARFEAERQALALMDHPNIAKVLDAGATPSGRPYFVMELVKGAPVTRYCDQKRLGVRERLGLFADVCRAVQHAHQKGVIHRDLKPTNVLVAPYDGRPVVKVIDFGIAKAAGQPLTERTLVTGFGAVVGTPEYMSPEQAELNNADIDTRSDVYSLGVVLYELLTGTTPLTRERVKDTGLLEVLRLVREEEPPRPSARLSTTAELPSIAAARATEAARLPRTIRGELDWIVMKALEKDRTRRYESAAGLAADVGRYLADEAVQACPPSWRYRTTKFARRNRVALLAAAAVLLVILPAVAGSIGWAAGDRAERRRHAEQRIDEGLAEVERLHAQGKWWAAREVVGGLEPLLAGVSPDRREQVEGWRADLDLVDRLAEIRLRQTAVRAGSFDKETADGEYAAALRGCGIDVEALDPGRAAELIRDRPARAELAAALDSWARTRGTTRRPDAKVWEKRLLEVARDADPDPTRARVRGALLLGDLAGLKELAGSPEAAGLPAATVVNLGNALWELGDTGGAVELFRRAQGRYPDDFWVNDSLGYYLSRLKPPQHAEALRFYTTAMAIDPLSPGARLNLGRALGEAGRGEEAMASYREAIRLKPDYAEAHRNLGYQLMRLGRDREAEASYREATRLKPDYALAHHDLGMVIARQGRLEDAEVCLREATRLAPGVPLYHRNRAIYLAWRGDLDAAIAAFREVVRLDPADAEAHNDIAWFSATRPGPTDRDLGLAVEHARRAVTLAPQRGDFWNTLGTVRYRTGDWTGAIEAFGKSAELQKGGDSVDFFFLAMAHWQLGDKAQARTWFDKGVGWMERSKPEDGELVRFRTEAAELLGILAPSPRPKGAR